ncbi:uncharacterized protein LOC126836805 isoform X1 [Adelges cooleyi]|uniref:uncharacterized protein LOC126836805 isoform X1 n=1 Tax=Adelges cooleyi TaxID=133065 RepID=UPI00218071A9|nr:uncharacterized protein LOC126836805 isoform X1 [Adelges cooleyi]
MIANNCAFLLCYFAITLKIKSMESAGNQIAPLRLYTQSTGPSYVQTINRLITYNKHPVSIKHADVILLSTRSLGTFLDYQLKLKSREKLEEKAEDIRCSFCVIAKSKLVYLKDLFVKLKDGEPFIDNAETVTRLKEETGIIIYLLMWGNLETGKWLWSYYLKIIAISQYEDNKRFIQENPFEDEQLQTGVLDFIENCIAKEYLPETAIESDLVSKKPKVYKNIFSFLRRTEIFADNLNSSITLAPTEFLYLKPFWEDANQILFKQLAGVNVDWSNVKQRHEVEVAITKEFVENRTWIYKPYERLDHQLLIIKIIDARFYCFFSVVLYIYEKQFNILDEQTMTDTRKLINNVLQDTLNLMEYKDDFLLNIISEFKFGIISDVNDIKDILARVRTKANEILNDLNGVSANEIDWFSFNVNEDQLSTTEWIVRIINGFNDYLNELTVFCLPFKYKVFLHFIDLVK